MSTTLAGVLAALFGALAEAAMRWWTQRQAARAASLTRQMRIMRINNRIREEIEHESELGHLVDRL